jgi:hypothetical protein
LASGKVKDPDPDADPCQSVSDPVTIAQQRLTIVQQRLTMVPWRLTMAAMTIDFPSQIPQSQKLNEIKNYFEFATALEGDKKK